MTFRCCRGTRSGKFGRERPACRQPSSAGWVQLKCVPCENPPRTRRAGTWNVLRQKQQPRSEAPGLRESLGETREKPLARRPHIHQDVAGFARDAPRFDGARRHRSSGHPDVSAGQLCVPVGHANVGTPDVQRADIGAMGSRNIPANRTKSRSIPRAQNILRTGALFIHSFG